jgi:hypothetical protein
MRPIALAGLAALLVATVTSADEPTAQSAVAAKTSKPDDQRSQSEGLIAKQFAQIRTEYEAEQAAHQPAAIKAESTRDKPDGAAKTSADLVAYCRRMVGLAESFPDDPAARDALLWVINTPGTAVTDVRVHRDQVRVTRPPS